jgi:hypothetical protein
VELANVAQFEADEFEADEFEADELEADIIQVSEFAAGVVIPAGPTGIAELEIAASGAIHGAHGNFSHTVGGIVAQWCSERRRAADGDPRQVKTRRQVSTASLGSPRRASRGR